MRKAKHTRTPIKLLAWFILLSALPLAALGWLGWRFFEQDRALEVQRLHDRLENAAGLTARDLDRALTTWEKLLSTAERDNSADLPPDSVLIVFDSQGIKSRKGVPLPYYPVVATPASTPPGVFATAEALEFREGNSAQAAAAYRVLAASRDKSVRAGALMRLARCLRTQGKLNESLDVYAELSTLEDVSIDGWPAELLAHNERIDLYKKIGSAQAAVRETSLLTSALWEGRFLIDRPTFDFLMESLEARRDKAPAASLADAIEQIWPQFQRQPAGRAALTSEYGSFAAVWQARDRQNSTGTAVLFGRVDALMKSAIGEAQNLAVRVALEDRSGQLSWGSIRGDKQVTKTSGETGLPWTIHVAPADSGVLQASAASRRNLLLAGFALMILVIAAASYFVFRAVNRELGVAQLQSDFVAAVSHEFRTPLTAMRHLTEMLEEGRMPADRLSQYYHALGRETRRLHEMVENLLDFGRLESGRRTFHMVETDAIEFATRVVDDFRSGTPAGNHRVQLLPDNEAGRRPQIRADREALTLALRNLLDNAVKYSPDSCMVRVSIEAHDGFAGISVQDQGCGIPKHEQRDVFRKFVRGSNAKTLNVKGAGIGLTMAHQIVRAHGGRLELDSEPGRGSRFTMLIPICG